jgi:flagellar biosynthetic protein FliO
MELFRKKSVTFLTAVAIIFGAICAHAEESVTEQDKETPTNNSTSTDDNKSDFDIDMGDDSDLGIREASIKLTFAVLMVIVLGWAAIYLSKKILPKLSSMSGKTIQVVETVHLGPRKSVHLLKIGNKQILVGSTNDNITKLADIPDLTTDQINDS